MSWFNKRKSAGNKKAQRRQLSLFLEALESRRLLHAGHAHEQPNSLLEINSPSVPSVIDTQGSGLSQGGGYVGSNVILSSSVPGGAPLILNAPGDALPSGNQFYLSFTLNWAGEEREEFQVLAKLGTQASEGQNELVLWQVFGTEQVELSVTVNGVQKGLAVPRVMVNGQRDWIVQVTNEGLARLTIDGTVQAEFQVGSIASIPRTTLQLGKNAFGRGAEVWGEYFRVRADVDGDAREDVVSIPPPRFPVPYTAKPIPDLPNPNPNGFLNTALLSNEERVLTIPDSPNSIVDTLALPYAWKGDVIAFSFNVQDIDNNGIADFDEGGWRAFFTNILGNVNEFTGLQFWERPEGVGTIQFRLTPGGGGASGLPGPAAAPTTGTLYGIERPVKTAGEQIGSIKFTEAFFHEIGHAFGLAHPHDYPLPDGMDSGIGQGVDSIPKQGDHFLNSSLYSSDSYSAKFWGEDNPFTPGVDFGTPLGGKLAQSTFYPMDIAALQYLYRTNQTFARGDDVYTFNDDHVSSRGLRTIWDNGGNDTIQYTGTRRSVINLNDATIRKEVGGGGFLSTSEVFEAGFFIANGVLVENAIGGEQQDFITGNEINNRLVGNGGNDEIKGEEGDDTLVGGLGNDILIGGPGFDTVELAGGPAEYTIQDQGNDTFLVTRNTGEVDTLKGVEQIRYDSGQVQVVSSLDPTLPSGMSFYATAKVRFDNLAGGSWQRVFDFGNGPEQNNILLTQFANTNTMRFAFYSGGNQYTVDAVNSLSNGEVAQWTAQVSTGGLMQLYKNGNLVAEQQVVAVPNVARTGLLVGKSHWAYDTDLIGKVISLVADNNGDQKSDVKVSDSNDTTLLPNGMSFYATAKVRFDNVAGGSWQRVFDFGNGPDQNNIFLTQVANTNTMRFAFTSGGTWYAMDAVGSLVNGEVGNRTPEP